MQFKKSAVVGVLITLYLSADSWCHYIPEKKPMTSSKKNGNSSHSERIQICGNALTTFIIEVCDGIVGSFNQGYPSRESVQTKITEDCCDQECPLDYLQSYCGETPILTVMKTLRGKLLSKSVKNRSSDFGAKEKTLEDGMKRRISEVRVREKNHRKRKWGKSREKRKGSFKWKCSYKSFGHFLFKLDRGDRVRSKMAKEQNSINRTWPSIQIGTISPEIDKFGGQPIVVDNGLVFATLSSRFGREDTAILLRTFFFFPLPRKIDRLDMKKKARTL